MLTALFSASAGQAVLRDGATFNLIDLAQNFETPIGVSSARLMLSGESDLVSIHFDEIGEFNKSIQFSWHVDRSIRMLQILLDDTELDDLRSDAIEAFDLLIEKEDVRKAVQYRSYCLPLSNSQTLPSPDVLSNCKISKAFLEELLAHQSSIKTVRKIWDELAEEEFGGFGAKIIFEREAVDKGAFFDLASAFFGDMEVDSALFDCFSALKELPNSRKIINSWTKDVRGIRSRKSLANSAEEHETPKETWSKRDNRSAFAKFENVNEQQAAIILALESGNILQARKFTAQLIAAQLKERDPSYAVKSLCKLAQEAKERYLHGLQLEWTEEALKLGPNDGWTNGQAGDAYLDVFKFKEADAHFNKASQLGQEAFAAGGKARLLSAKGDYEGAARAFADAIQKYGETDRSELYWIGYGHALRRLWRFDEAHAIWSDAHEKFPRDMQIMLGLARSKRDLGLLDSAYDLLNRAIAFFPNRPEPVGALLNTYRSGGNFSAAYALFERSKAKFPHNANLLIAYARTLSEAGKHSEALTVAEDATKTFDTDPSVFTNYVNLLVRAGNMKSAISMSKLAVRRFSLDIDVRTVFANTLRAAGDFAGALQAFEQNVRDFPYDAYSLNGQANLLKRLGYYGQSLEAYGKIREKLPRYEHAIIGAASVFVILKRYDEAERMLLSLDKNTVAHWYGEHVKAMLLLKKNLAAQARKLFESGIKNCPYYRIRKLLELGLAAANLRLGKLSEVSIKADNSEPIRHILLAHALFEIGNSEDARREYNYANDNLTPALQQLRAAVGIRYGIEKGISRSVAWIFDREEDAILQAA